MQEWINNNDSAKYKKQDCNFVDLETINSPEHILSLVKDDANKVIENAKSLNEDIPMQEDDIGIGYCDVMVSIFYHGKIILCEL